MSGGRGSKRGNGSGKKSTPGKKGGGTTPCIDLTSFGFTKKKSTITSSANKKKRPAIAVDTSSAASAVTVVARGGGNNAADDTSPSSSVEIITSPTKRAKSSKKAASSTAAAPASIPPSFSSSTTPAKKNNNSNGKRKAVASANSNSSQCSGGSQRVALLDLTQDSSSADSMDKKQPAAALITKKSKGAGEVSSAAGGGNNNKQIKSSKITATSTLSSMAGTIVNKLIAPPPNNPSSTNQPQQQKQRRGKRDKHQQKGGVKRSKEDKDGPIEIYEDDGSNNNVGEQEKISANNNNDNYNKKMKSNNNTPLFTVGAVVTVQDRTWPGRNDPGGVAKILRVHHHSSSSETKYDVKYVLESRKEKNVEECYITEHSEYTSPEKAKNGRNGFATKRPSRPPPMMNHAGMMKISSEGGISGEGDEEENVAKKRDSPTKSTMMDNKISPPQEQQRPRENSIQAYFSPTKDSSPKKKKISPKNVKFPKGTKSSSSSPSRPQNMRANALGLVRVQDPHAITCSTAVAQYKSKPFDPTSATSKNDAKRVFPGAILGRASAKVKSNFVDLGISNSAAGISRHHVKVLAVKGLVEGVNNGSSSQLSQTSTNTSGSTNDPQFITPTLTIQVDEKSSNGVQVHKTKRGHRGEKYLGQGCQETLRIGDAIVFFSNEHLHYCVVGLKYPEGGEGSNNGAVGGEWNNNAVGKEDAARLLEFTPKEKTKKKTKDGSCANDGEGQKAEGSSSEKKKKEKESAETDKTLDVDNDNDIMEVVEIVDKPAAAKMKSGTQETSGTKTDESMMDVTMELEESPQPEKTESPVEGTKSSSTVAAVVKKEETGSMNETTLIQKGDEVKIIFVVNDMFGEDNKEW